MVGVHGRLIADLVARRGLDRELEVLPDDAGFAALESAGAGLTSPELATLLAHTKLDLTAQILDTDLPDTPAFADRLPGTSRARCGNGSPPRSRATRCAARSWRPCSSTRWSTAPA